MLVSRLALLAALSRPVLTDFPHGTRPMLESMSPLNEGSAVDSVVKVVTYTCPGAAIVGCMVEVWSP